MIRTITLGSSVQVQGTFVRTLGKDRIIVRVGEQTFAGKPVTAS
ncbi:MAG: hypothetical protein AAFO58_04485 [Pseudomonadota bacterium]